MKRCKLRNFRESFVRMKPDTSKNVQTVGTIRFANKATGDLREKQNTTSLLEKTPGNLDLTFNSVESLRAPVKIKAMTLTKKRRNSSTNTNQI